MYCPLSWTNNFHINVTNLRGQITVCFQLFTNFILSVVATQLASKYHGINLPMLDLT